MKKGEKMKLLTEDTLNNSLCYRVYEVNEHKKYMRFTFSIRCLLLKYLEAKKIQLDIAWIRLDPTWMGYLYHQNPNIVIIINPIGFYELVVQFNPNVSGQHREDEIAATLEEKSQEDKKEVTTFLTEFYQAYSVNEAYTRFVEWQCKRSLKNVLGNKIVDLFQLYEEEVFNYFRYSSLFRK